MAAAKLRLLCWLCIHQHMDACIKLPPHTHAGLRHLEATPLAQLDTTRGACQCTTVISSGWLPDLSQALLCRVKPYIIVQAANGSIRDNIPCVYVAGAGAFIMQCCLLYWQCQLNCVCVCLLFADMVCGVSFLLDNCTGAVVLPQR